MNVIGATIDSLYEGIIRLSVHVVSSVHEAFSWDEEPAPSETRREVLVEQILTDTPPPTPVPTFRTIDEVLRTKMKPDTAAEGSAETEINHSAVVKNMVMYTSSAHVPVYQNPTIEFDTKIASIPYGEMVMMIDVRGRFHKIIWNDVSGWVLKDDVVDKAVKIQPKLIIGEENQSDSPNTVHIRAMISDEFGVGQTDFSLQAGEYVLYKLWEKNHVIEWPKTRPRTPGMWHKILRGVPKVHIGVVPKADAIMEYVHEDSFGHVAYVDAVYPDETISISEANFPDSGKYNERTLTKDEWKELRPVFINIQ